MESLVNKVVLITGAGTGIGESTALEFSKYGCFVALNGRNETNLARTAKKCIAAGLPESKVLVTPGDVSVESDVENVVDMVLKTFGKLDILINNAGQLGTSSIVDCDVKEFDRLMTANARSVVLVTKYAIKHLIQTKGAIVNVSSISGLRPMENCLFYCMSKAGVDMFTRVTSTELGPYGVRVNGVNPGVIKTEVHLRSGMSPQQYNEYLAMQKVLSPLGRHGLPEEVARVIVFLASPASWYVSGVTLPIDGARVNVTPRYAKL